MKKSLSLLLALTLCAVLVLPALASPGEEPPARSETETIQMEEDTSLAEPIPEEADEPEEAIPVEEDVVFPDLDMEAVRIGTLDAVYYHLPDIEQENLEILLAQELTDGTSALISWHCDSSNLVCEEVETENGITRIGYGTIVIDNYSIMEVAELDNCSVCGKNNWGPGTEKDPEYKNPGNASTHTVVYTTIYVCKTAGCNGGLAVVSTGTELHSMVEVGYTDNDYHAGKFHYAEYLKRCTQCDYKTTYWKYYLCPGNPCIAPTSLEDELMEVVPAPEEVITSEGTE